MTTCRVEIVSTPEQRLIARLYVALAGAWDMAKLDEPARGRFFRDGVPSDEYDALCTALWAAGRGEECGWLAQWIRSAAPSETMRRERVLIVPKWAAELAREELGRDLTAADVPPPGFWDRVEAHDPESLRGT